MRHLIKRCWGMVHWANVFKYVNTQVVQNICFSSPASGPSFKRFTFTQMSFQMNSEGRQKVP